MPAAVARTRPVLRDNSPRNSGGAVAHGRRRVTFGRSVQDVVQGVSRYSLYAWCQAQHACYGNSAPGSLGNSQVTPERVPDTWRRFYGLPRNVSRWHYHSIGSMLYPPAKFGLLALYRHACVVPRASG